MYRVSIERHFDAAHYLRNYQGKCENLHGHRYRVIAHVVSSELDTVGLAFDFTVLKKNVDEILDRYDHTCLNDIEPFDTVNPSSENIAAAVYRELSPKLSGSTASLESIEVWESPDSWVTYTPG